jgi:hypothetical protein
MRSRGPRLIGVEMTSGLVAPTALPLDGCVVLLGANGSGKSTILRLLERGADLGHRARPSPTQSWDYDDEDIVTFAVDVGDDLHATWVEPQLGRICTEFVERYHPPPPAAVVSALRHHRTVLLKGAGWGGAALALPTLDEVADAHRPEFTRWLATIDHLTDSVYEGGPVSTSALGDGQRVAAADLGMPPETLAIDVISVPLGLSMLEARIGLTVQAVFQSLSPLSRMSFPERDVFAPTEAFATVARRIGQVATALAGPMLQGAVISVSPCPERTWPTGEAVRLEVRTAPSDDAYGSRYERGPQGLRLWVELAVLQALDVLNRTAEDPDAARPFRVDEVDHLADWLLAGQEVEHDTHLSAVIAAARAQPRALRLFLIDEPEVSLHPRLQRQLPEALSALSQHGTVVGATHSPYLAVGRAGFTFAQALPAPSERVQAIEIPPEALSAQGALAEELGFDRGELMALVNLVVFVEGPTDAALLEGLLGPEAQRRGVLFIPIHGVVRAEHKGTVDAAWIRLGSWPLVFVTDKLTTGDLADRAEGRAVKEASRSPGTEAKAVERLLDLARREERRLHLVGHGSGDIFDLIDDEILQGLARNAKRTWPGHQEARRAGGAKWKQKYRDMYGLDPLDETLYAAAGRAMRRTGRVPPDLQRLVDDILRVSHS